MIVFLGLLVCILGVSLTFREAFGASTVSGSGGYSASEYSPRIIEFLFVVSWFAFVIWFTWPLTPILAMAASDAFRSLV